MPFSIIPKGSLQIANALIEGGEVQVANAVPVENESRLEVSALGTTEGLLEIRMAHAH